MNGRIFTIKKTTLLRLSFILCSLFYLISTVLFIVFEKINDAWFFNFVFFIGLFLIIKSILFKQDSSCYFGFILFLIGFFFYLAYYFRIGYLYSVFIILAFSISSFNTYVFFNQPFQFYISLSLFFAATLTFIFIINVISIEIFLALMGAVVLLLCCSYFFI